MNLKSRVRRRQRNRNVATLVHDYEAISPVAHVAEPIGREPVLERFLNYLDPVFDRELPSNAYVWGPAGAGKSAVVTALSAQFQRQLSQLGSVIYRAARQQSGRESWPTFVYVDARSASTEFGLTHAVLDALVDEPVPKRGVKAETLVSRIEAELAPSSQRVIVAVDHVGEPETYPLSTVDETLDRIDASLSWVAVGRSRPEDVEGTLPPERIEIPGYRHHTLVDIVSNRATEGLAGGAIRHEQTYQIARWADGNAHDALTALFGAADRATAAGRKQIEDSDLTHALRDVPQDSVSLARTLLLPPNRQRVLRSLLTIGDADRSSVGSAADAIAATGDVDLSAGTVKRFLYEFADTGIVERVNAVGASESPGRPQSKVEPRFPTHVFRRLYDGI